jgi:large-conductance mechanosensitive channel
MDAPSKQLAADLSPAESRKWMGRLLIAVVLGAAIWNVVASLTGAVIMPALARVMETDPQSPLYLGKGDFNVPAIFTSVLELCFAAIAALLVSSWSQRRPRAAQRKSASFAPAASLSISAPAIAPVREPVRQTPSPAASPVVPPPVSQEPASPALSKVTAAQAPAPPPPAKPKPPKEVYYNSVGEIVERDDE